MTKTCNKYITKIKISQINKPRGKKVSNTDEPKEYVKNPYSRVYSAIRKITDTLIQNFEPHLKFTTLTLDKEYQTTDIDVLHNYVVNFVRRTENNYRKQKRYKDFELKYIWVPELHKNNRSYHIHMLSNLPFINMKAGERDKDGNYINPLAKLWKYGKIVDTRDLTNPKDMGNYLNVKTPIENFASTVKYLCKYLSKGFKEKADDETRKGHNLYYMSKNWQKPVYIHEELTIEKKFNLISKIFVKGFKWLYWVAKSCNGKFTPTYHKMRGWSLEFIIDTKMYDKFYKELFEVGLGGG